MKILLQILSIIGLMFTLLPSFFHFFKIISLDTHKMFMLIGTILWFGTAVFWIGKKKEAKLPSNQK